MASFSWYNGYVDYVIGGFTQLEAANDAQRPHPRFRMLAAARAFRL